MLSDEYVAKNIDTITIWQENGHCYPFLNALKHQLINDLERFATSLTS